MKTIEWTRDELIAYVLLYAANSDFKESNTERNIIISKVDMQTFQDIHNEFDHHNDYQSINKIMTSLKQHAYTSDDVDVLMTDIQTLFFSDGNFNINEQNMFRCLNRLFKSL
ncbi:hypothetical protein [Winogradskyella aurantiaca]|uniref:hypothetical protein n=1 Tax=Winogradskyella aurantiaca TaxID=2219558 RepID=UPI000E1CE5A5|nr:hypothetical protein [Winogradskyella aurantiaca]